MLAFMCSQCEGREKYQPSEWFNHIMFLYGLQRGGYPFRANDLTIDEWLDLGTVRDHFHLLTAKGY